MRSTSAAIRFANGSTFPLGVAISDRSSCDRICVNDGISRKSAAFFVVVKIDSCSDSSKKPACGETAAETASGAILADDATWGREDVDSKFMALVVHRD